MPYTGAFQRGAAVDPAAPPDLDRRHGLTQLPDTNWSEPPASIPALPTAGDYDRAGDVDPPMSGRGAVRDLGHQFGHAGTAATRRARAPYRGRDSQLHADTASAAAHADTRAGYWPAHTYSPGPTPFAGERYDVDYAQGRPGEPLPVRAITKSRPGGEFSDGSGGDMAPTGFRLGISRRFAVAHYSSPLLGAQHRSYVARGVLPQVVTVPVDQPASGRIMNSGLSSQQRQQLQRFTIPRLFRAPPSTSDSALAEQQSAPIVGPVI